MTGSGTSSGSDKESPPPQPSAKKQKCDAKLSSSESRGKSTITNGALASRPVPSVKLSKMLPAHTEAAGESEETGSTDRDKVLEMAANRKVYKSLFSSNATQRPKEKTSNWVTFFPYH